MAPPALQLRIPAGGAPTSTTTTTPRPPTRPLWTWAPLLSPTTSFTRSRQARYLRDQQPAATGGHAPTIELRPRSARPATPPSSPPSSLPSTGSSGASSTHSTHSTHSSTSTSTSRYVTPPTSPTALELPPASFFQPLAAAAGMQYSPPSAGSSSRGGWGGGGSRPGSAWSGGSERERDRPAAAAATADWDEFAPACAVCGLAAAKRCECEFASLVAAVEESEQRTLAATWDDVRRWVTDRATRTVQADYRSRAALRRAKFDEYLVSHRRQLTAWDVDELRWDLQKGIDADWRAAVARYPQELDRYNQQVALAVRSGQGIDSIIGRRRPR